MWVGSTKSFHTLLAGEIGVQSLPFLKSKRRFRLSTFLGKVALSLRIQEDEGMNSSLAASFLSPVLVFLFLIFAPHLPAWAQVEPTASPQTAFVFFQRTRGHARNSTPDVFKQVVDDIQGFLKANTVAVVINEDLSSWGDELPLSAVQQMAHDSKAAYLLYVVVDRPLTKWLKVTVQCYDA